MLFYELSFSTLGSDDLIKSIVQYIVRLLLS